MRVQLSEKENRHAHNKKQNLVSVFTKLKLVKCRNSTFVTVGLSNKRVLKTLKKNLNSIRQKSIENI